MIQGVSDTLKSDTLNIGIGRCVYTLLKYYIKMIFNEYESVLLL